MQHPESPKCNENKPEGLRIVRFLLDATLKKLSFAYEGTDGGSQLSTWTNWGSTESRRILPHLGRTSPRTYKAHCTSVAGWGIGLTVRRLICRGVQDEAIQL
jgi:hypothetical protein